MSEVIDSAQPAGVGEHDAIEVLPLSLGQVAPLQCLQVQADGGDGGLQLVRDGVQEGILPLVSAHLADKEDGVQHDPGDQQSEQDQAENKQHDAAFVQHDPRDVERDQAADDQHAQRDG